MLLIDVCDRVLKLLLCVHEVMGLISGCFVWFTNGLFLEIFGDHCLSYRVCALSHALGRELAVLFVSQGGAWPKPDPESLYCKRGTL